MLQCIYRKKEVKEMATRLEIAKQKLIRLENEYSNTIENAFAHQRLTNGQPMNDKRNGASWFKRQSQLENNIYNRKREIEKQKERVEMLERQEYNKENNLTANGGLQTSIHNIDKLKERKQDKKTRAKVEMLEKMLEKEKEDKRIMSDHTQNLIDLGYVKQWQKQPIYYFINGLRKVALIIDETGNFKVSKKYPIKNENDKNFVEELIKQN